MSVAVCTPALINYQKDFSIRLIEWLELLKAMGVAKVHLYKSSIHPKMEKVLRYYEKSGFATITNFGYPQPLQPDHSLKRYVFSHLNTNAYYLFTNKKKGRKQKSYFIIFFISFI